MKTQILQVEAHDDVISILDKIGWIQTERVLLVLPRRRRVLNHKLDLLRLKRQSQKKGCQLALVTHDPLIKALARESNIPTYHSIQKAHQADWPRQNSAELSARSASATLSKPPLSAQISTIQALRASHQSILPLWARVVWFSIAILAVISLLGILAPSATIHITPPFQQQSVSIPLVATQRVQQARLSGEVPISMVRISVSGQKTIKVSGTIRLPKDFAQGEVVLTNLTDQPIEVPAGSVVRTLDAKPRRYATLQNVLLKSGDEKSATIKVKALEAGSAQNAQPNEIKSLEGLLGLRVSVDNPQPIEGGSDMLAPAPSAQDRQLLFRELEAELIEKAKRKVSEEMIDGDLLLPDSAIESRVLRQQYTPDETIATDLLSLDLELEVGFGIVARQTLMELGNQLLASSLPNGYIPLQDTFVAHCLDAFAQTENEDYRCTIEISRQIQLKVDPEQVRNLVVGKPIHSVSQQLNQTYPLSKPPTFEIFPQWFPVLPWLPMRIEIVIEK